MALTKIDDRGLKTPIDLLDNEKIRLGTGNDLQIYTSGSNSVITHNGDGNLQLTTGASGEDILLQAYGDIDLKPNNGDNGVKIIGGGAVSLYHNNARKLETFTDGVQLDDNIVIKDNKKAFFGDGYDLQIFHNSSDDTNRFYLSGKATTFWTGASNNHASIKITDGETPSVELYYDNSLKFKTSSGGAHSYGVLSTSNDITIGNSSDLTFEDNGAAKFGTGADLQIYHDTNNSLIKETGTGVLAISGSEVHIQNGIKSESIAKFIGPDNASHCELYYDDSKKFETVSGGVKVTGSCELSSSTQAILWPEDPGTNASRQWDFRADQGAYGQFGLKYGTSSGDTPNKLAIEANANGNVELYYDGVKHFETNATGTYFNEKQLSTGGSCKFRTYGGPVSIASNSYHDCQLSSNFGNDSAIRIEYSYNWNDGNGGAWGSAVVWNEHDSANTRTRFLGEEIAGPGTSVEFVTSGSNVYFRFNTSGMNGTFIIAAYATQCDLY